MSRSSRWLAVAGLTAAALAGYLVSQAVLPGPHPRMPAAQAGRHSAVTVTGPMLVRPSSTPAASTNSEGVGSRSANGAVSAAADYLQLLDGTAPPAARSAGLRAVTVAPLTSQALRAASATVALTDRLSARGPAVIDGWRLGWRVLSYTPHRAQVAIWTMGIAASPALVLSPDWSTTTCTVKWSEDSWRVATAQTSAGPTPPAAGAGRSVIAGFARSASRFEEFGDAS